MRTILFCGLKYEYGNPNAGLSFEYQNFYSTLESMPEIRVECFAMDEHVHRLGREDANEALLARVRELQPDLVFFVPFENELLPQMLTRVTAQTKTLAWFCDDHWRFPMYSQYYAPHFTAVATTDSQAVARYTARGITVLKTQWAANPALYKPTVSQPADAVRVAFVGQRSGRRGVYIEALMHAGLPVVVHGAGWPLGRLSFEQMVESFSNTDVHLNFSGSPYHTAYRQLRLFARLLLAPDGRTYEWHRPTVVDALQSVWGSRRNQIKGRTFEIPACGSMLLTNAADNLEEYFMPGKEIAVFENVDDLVEKCQYFLTHPEERLAIARAGYERVLREHTYSHRFTQLFTQLGL
ncbi:MAG: glycosyltransferase [Candidatus Doudnabacteria bacterium]|nr:glycosyltransferase [Candidatus Doudnabacteria bacterium]